MQEAALAIVTNDTNEILLVQRQDVPVWVLPGGGIEANETAEIAVIRETFEETGMRVEVRDHIATYSPVNKFSAHTHLFVCYPTTNDRSFSLQSEEVSDVRFFPLCKLPSKLFPIHQALIDEWIRTESIPILRPLSEASYPALLKLIFSHPFLAFRYIANRIKRKR